jgi:HEAT repeat protein
MQDEKVKLALIDLLDRENQVAESTLRDSNEHVGISAKCGEEYGEYIDQLGDTVDSFADWSDPHQVCILVHQSYEPDSRFAAKIADHARVSVPCLIQMYGSDVGLLRAEAAPVIARALAQGKTELDPEIAQQAREIVLRALKDPHDAVRSKTVRSLGRFGGVDMIPALNEVAQSDPTFRDTATKAISDIQKRAGQN